MPALCIDAEKPIAQMSWSYRLCSQSAQPHDKITIDRIALHLMLSSHCVIKVVIIGRPRSKRLERKRTTRMDMEWNGME